MVSPHLLEVIYSYSSSHPSEMTEQAAKGIPSYLGWDIPTSAHQEDTPVLILGAPTKDSKWLHAIMAEGPVLNNEEDVKCSELIIIWWSQMGPDTDRVLSAVDWEKHAKNYK